MQVLVKYSKRELVQIINQLGVYNNSILSAFHQDLDYMRADKITAIHNKADKLVNSVINSFPYEYGAFREEIKAK